MRRALPAALLLAALVAATPAQSSEATGAPAPVLRKAIPSTYDVARAWLARGGREAVRRLKASQAEALVRAAPKRFSGVKDAATTLATKIGRGVGSSLQEKRNLVVALWRLRGSLDVLALLDPHTLETLTGLDGKTLANIRASADEAGRRLGLLASPRRPR